MKLGTILVNYRTAPLTLQAVQALQQATRELGSSKVWVIDNHSGDGSVAALRAGVSTLARPEQVEIVASPINGGFGAGCNVGIRAALELAQPPEYLYFLNPDAFPRHDAVTSLVDFLDRHPRAAVVGSYCTNENGSRVTAGYRFPTLASELEHAASVRLMSRLLRHRAVTLPIHDEPSRCDWVTGASFMVRRAALTAVGTFDERFFLYFEEVDLCRRIKEAGHEVWTIPSSRVVHVGGASTKAADRAEDSPHWIASRRHYFTKHHGARYAAAAETIRLLGKMRRWARGLRLRPAPAA